MSVKPCVGGGHLLPYGRACEMPACECPGSIICEDIAVDVIMNLPQKSEISHIPPEEYAEKAPDVCFHNKERASSEDEWVGHSLARLARRISDASGRSPKNIRRIRQKMSVLFFD